MAYTFTGSEGGPISLDQMNQWMSNYQNQQQSNFPGKTIIKGHFLGSEKIKQLLDEKDAVGIRIYYGVNQNGTDTIMVVAARADMSDILPDPDGGGPIILDDTLVCPPYCPK